MGRVVGYTRSECLEAIAECNRESDRLEGLIADTQRQVTDSLREIDSYTDRIVEMKTDPMYACALGELSAARRLLRRENRFLGDLIEERDRYLRDKRSVERDKKLWELALGAV